jgi:hypothetical protein
MTAVAVPAFTETLSIFFRAGTTASKFTIQLNFPISAHDEQNGPDCFFH